ncbi:ABC transporter permease [Puia sp. P3]|uniref:ABC transporter permease n=1 Tax=Puia sp. P3 TaxID=3423952 RepID=UPI003D668DBC
MFKNYFRVAWRALVNNKAFSFINIFGLSLGMACSLLIVLWVADELGTDNFHKDVSRIYMMYETESIDGKRVGGYWTPGLLVQELKRKIPEIQYGSAIMDDERTNFEVGNKKMKMDGLDADSDYFKIFSYPLVGRQRGVSPEHTRVHRHLRQDGPYILWQCPLGHGQDHPLRGPA